MQMALVDQSAVALVALQAGVGAMLASEDACSTSFDTWVGTEASSWVALVTVTQLAVSYTHLTLPTNREV